MDIYVSQDMKPIWFFKTILAHTLKSAQYTATFPHDAVIRDVDTVQAVALAKNEFGQ